MSIQIRIILLKMFVVLVKEVYLQILPITPCPTIFQYQFDGINWFGRLKLENSITTIDRPLHLKVTLSVRGNPLTNYLGEIELLTRGPPVETNSPVFYNVRFPLTSIPPKLINVIVDNRTICSGQRDFGVFVTLIQLEHTREFTFLSKSQISHSTDFSKPEESSRNFFINTSIENQQIILQQTCGNINKSLSELKVKDDSLLRGFWPWLTAIYVNNYTSLTYICGGSIVSQNVVITAAHCFHLYQKKYFANEVLVFLGRHNLQNWNEDGSIISSVDNIFIHPDYDNNLSSYDADIALLILKNKINFSDFIKPICLWNDTHNTGYTEGDNGIVVGWGFDEYNLLSSTPRKLQANIVNNKECIKTDKKYGNILSSRSFCAGGDLPCVGYSGAGLMLYKNKRWQLRGIVSSSLPGSCKFNKYVIYTDSSKFLDWIYAFII